MQAYAARFFPLLFLLPVAAADETGLPAFEFQRKPGKVRHAIELREIIKGVRKPGDPRDAIPPIYKPKVVGAKEAEAFLRGSQRVLGVRIGKEARAYPIYILTRHEMVNDVLGGRPIAPNY